MTEMSPIIEFRDVSVRYTMRAEVREAVRGASFEVRAGQAVGIVGESGSGKSTLARALIGLLPRPSAEISGGHIYIQGKDVTSLSDSGWTELRGHPIAMIFQDPLSYLNPIKRIGNQIAEAVRKHAPSDDADARTRELISTVKLPPTAIAAYPYQLSGGMRQRVLIAIALACRPLVLVADEPTTALDPTTQAEILALIRELRAALGMSLVLISHDLEVVAAECDYINVMYAGRIVESGASRTIFKAPQHAYTQQLLRCARAELNADGRFVTIDREGLAASAAADGAISIDAGAEIAGTIAPL